ncbi:MAG: asparagine--tRNA ligase [Peptococcaceae bacterium]|nr:asparagine--tRNA ligase [Peptococcaceae bacterium]
MLIKHLLESYASCEAPVALNGWVRTIRKSKDFGFIELNDGTTLQNIQLIYDNKLDNFEAVSHLTVGSAIACQGRVVLTEGHKQDFEVHLDAVDILNLAPSDYPLQKKRHSFEYLRTQAHLRPRTNTFSAVFRLRSKMAYAVHQFFQERDFIYVQTPIITASDAEGAGEMFSITTGDDAPFFGRPANLSVSGQLNAEAYALAFQNVYTFGPTFRAENSNTTRHAAEFWMIEPEIAFADLGDNIQLAEDFIRHIIDAAFTQLPNEMDFFDQRIEKGLIERLTAVKNAHFARMTYTEAVELLMKEKVDFTFPVSWGIDLQSEHERYLTEHIVGGPVFLIDYPKDIKAFYMRENDDHKTVAAMDLLVPGIGEIVGGSQREERLDLLTARMQALGMDLAAYDWYLDLRRFGGVKHAGFGVGFERLLMYLSGMGNIRDVIPFPRTPGSILF